MTFFLGVLLGMLTTIGASLIVVADIDELVADMDEFESS